MVELIYDDKRQICELRLEGGKFFRAGVGNCSSIEAYKEHGIGDFAPYYAVKDSWGRITHRVPAHMAVVEYHPADMGPTDA